MILFAYMSPQFPNCFHIVNLQNQSCLSRFCRRFVTFVYITLCNIDTQIHTDIMPICLQPFKQRIFAITNLRQKCYHILILINMNLSSCLEINWVSSFINSGYGIFELCNFTHFLIKLYLLFWLLCLVQFREIMILLLVFTVYQYRFIINKEN